MSPLQDSAASGALALGCNCMASAKAYSAACMRGEQSISRVAEQTACHPALAAASVNHTHIHTRTHAHTHIHTHTRAHTSTSRLRLLLHFTGHGVESLFDVRAILRTAITGKTEVPRL